MFEYFYNEIFRKTIIAFGTLFNGMEIKQEGSVTRVPLAYGPTILSLSDFGVVDFLDLF